MGIIKIVQFVWGFPQTIIGLIIFLIIKGLKKSKEVCKYKTSVVTIVGEKWGGVSLGNFIFIANPSSKKYRESIVKHEYGHSIQSLILGPLYLIVIGIPSAIWNLFFKNYRKKNNISYYSFWCEKNADWFGNVKR